MTGLLFGMVLPKPASALGQCYVQGWGESRASPSLSWLLLLDVGLLLTLCDHAIAIMWKDRARVRDYAEEGWVGLGRRGREG